MDEKDIGANMRDRDDIFDRFGSGWDKDDMFFDTLPPSWRLPRVRPNLSGYTRRPMFTDMDDNWHRPSFDDTPSSTGKERIIPIQVEGDSPKKMMEGDSPEKMGEGDGPEKMVVDAPFRPTHRSFAGLAATRASSCPPAPADPQRPPLRRASGDSPATTQRTSKACQQIARVAEAVRDLADQVHQFSGSRDDRQFRYLDEMLTRQLLSLDDIDTNGEAAARAARRQVVVNIQETLSRLDSTASKTTPDTKQVDSQQSVESNEPAQICEDSKQMENLKTMEELNQSSEGNDNFESDSSQLDNKDEEKGAEGSVKIDDNNDEHNTKNEKLNEKETGCCPRTENESDTPNSSKIENSLSETANEEIPPKETSCIDNQKGDAQESPHQQSSGLSTLPDSDETRSSEDLDSAGSVQAKQDQTQTSSAEDIEQQKEHR